MGNLKLLILMSILSFGWLSIASISFMSYGWIVCALVALVLAGVALVLNNEEQSS